MWGLTGGLAAELLGFMAAVTASGFRWPWRDDPDGRWPRLFVAAGGLVLGALVAAAAHGQISGAWPAFIMGVGARATVRGLVSGIEVTERKPEQDSGGEGGDGDDGSTGTT